MKKALVSTMSLIISAALLSGAALTTSAGYEKVVIATEKGGVLLDEDFKLGNGTYQKYSGEDRVLQYGDVIVFGGDGLKDVSIDPIDQFPHYYNFPDDPSDFSIKHLGTAEEVYADNIKELTVTQALENGCVKFVDADGQACTWHTSVDKWLTDTGYYQYDFTTPDGFHPSDYQVGDVVRCVMEEDGKSVLLPLTPAPEQEETIICVVAVSEYGVCLSNEMYIPYEDFQKLSGTDRVPQYGDVLKRTYSSGIEVVPMDPPRYLSYGDLQFAYLDTAENYYAAVSVKLTVAEVSNDTLTLKAEDGTVYEWSEPSYFAGTLQFPESYAMEDYQVGDTATFAVDAAKNEVILPLTPAPEHASIKGDVDCNGTVNIMDVILLNRYMMVGAEISEQGMQNALTYTANDGIATQSDNVQRQPDAVDALNILKYIVELITELA